MILGRIVQPLAVALCLAAVSCAQAPAFQPAKPLPVCPRTHGRALTETERKTIVPVQETWREGGYRRRCEVFPIRGPYEETMRGLFELCVHPEGFVYDVTVKTSTSLPELDTRFINYARSWRYAPLVRDGRPVAFCHPMQVIWRSGDAGPGEDP